MFSLRKSQVIVHNVQLRKFSQSLTESFSRASRAINSPDNPKEVSNDTKLKLYGLFKQVDTGPCSTSKPGIFDPVGRAKHDAWSGLGKMTKDDAMKSYVEVVTKIFDGNLPESKEEIVTKPASSVTVKEELTLENVAFPKRKELDLSALNLETITSSLSDKGVASIVLNRPNKGNSFNMKMWNDLNTVFQSVAKVNNPRVVILSGSKGTFSTGMDLTVFMDLQKIAAKETCEGRKREGIMNLVQFLQDSISLPEKCEVPVIAAISGNCIGGAVDLIAACDLRYCTKNAIFCVKETDLAIVADIGTLQRLPTIIGNQRAAEATYTGRNITGDEALEMGLVLKIFETEAEMMSHVTAIAEQIAAKSPITVRGVKRTLIYQRDHTVADSLNQVKLWNSAFLFSDDLLEATGAMMTKRSPVFKA